jgi:thiamine pyrophosphokinase
MPAEGVLLLKSPRSLLRLAGIFVFVEVDSVRILIFANGVVKDPSSEVATWYRSGDLIVAADGGMSHIIDADLMPDHVVGDMDSLPKSLKNQLRYWGCRLHESPAQKDETDLELALLWVAETYPNPEDVEQVVVLGAFGGRPDQALANLLLLALPELRGLDVLLVDRAWIVRLLRGGETLRLEGQPGDRVSLIPLGGTAEGIETTGLAYPLNSESLAFGPARGVSNRLEGTTAVVRLAKGRLWCFHERRSE